MAYQKRRPTLKKKNKILTISFSKHGHSAVGRGLQSRSEEPSFRIWGGIISLGPPNVNHESHQRKPSSPFEPNLKKALIKN